MYQNLYLKFKDILKRISNRINEFIDININNPYLVESKLLLINNYIIDTLNTTDISQSSFIDIQNQDNSQYNLLNPLISSHGCEENKKILNKFKRKYFNSIKDKNEKAIHSYNDFNINSDNKKELTPNKYRIIKLKRKLEDEHEKSKIKELSYIKHINAFPNIILFQIK